jgi:hypothetical protein
MRYRCGSGNGWRDAVTENVSRSGVLFVAALADTSPAADARIEMQLQMPPVEGAPGARVVCMGRIVRAGSAGTCGQVAARFDRSRLETGANGGGPEQQALKRAGSRSSGSQIAPPGAAVREECGEALLRGSQKD